jgi:hypothetical protein
LTVGGSTTNDGAVAGRVLVLCCALVALAVGTGRASAASITLPSAGATTTASPAFTIALDAGESAPSIHVTTSAQLSATGEPAGEIASCVPAAAAGVGARSCRVPTALEPGTYYVWLSYSTADPAAGVTTPHLAGPSSFVVAARAKAQAKSRLDAASLPSALDYTGKSIKDTTLSRATYALSKAIGIPKTLAVACWSAHDWPTVSLDDDPVYGTTAFWWSSMPRWINLSPQICRAMETLLEHRPRYPNVFTADAVVTLTHETMHALGIEKEAMAECFGMQLTAVTAVELGLPEKYAYGLARLTLDDYKVRPPSYRDPVRCREDGAWDLFAGRPSPPWHEFR